MKTKLLKRLRRQSRRNVYNMFDGVFDIYSLPETGRRLCLDAQRDYILGYVAKLRCIRRICRSVRIVLTWLSAISCLWNMVVSFAGGNCSEGMTWGCAAMGWLCALMCEYRCSKLPTN